MKYNELIVRAYFRDCKLPPAETEYRFKLDRRWRFDWAWPDKKIALEVDGGIWIRGGHNRGAQMLKTWEKENAAASIGWRILRCQPQDLCTLELVELLRKALSC